jgi:3-dehydroquinate synthase
MFESIKVHTSNTDRYSIAIGDDLLKEMNTFVSSNFGTNKVFLIIDQNVHNHHISRIEQALQHSFSKILKYVVPAGERSKSFDQYSSILDFILSEGIERNVPLIAIGGGVVGDLAGFVAASALRGIPLIHVPTSLLAMVDSSIGGKTGINHSTGKNLIGSFYQPKAVFADVSFLRTLPKEEWVSGLSEILKYAMIERPQLFDELQALTANGKFAKPTLWLHVIKQSAAIKVDIVQRDVHERGARAFLNFGHTYAHVIERMGNYGQFSHGEAVFAGMYGAIKASQLLGYEINTKKLDAFKSLYTLDVSILNERIDELTPLMLKDKKVENEAIRLILVKELGKPEVRTVENHELINESWNFLIQTFN